MTISIAKCKNLDLKNMGDTSYMIESEIKSDILEPFFISYISPDLLR